VFGGCVASRRRASPTQVVFGFYFGEKIYKNIMQIFDIKHPFDTFIDSGDIKSEKNFLLIDDQNNIYRNNQKIDVPLLLLSPIARIISDKYFLLVDSEREYENAWIINNSGIILHSFYVGNARNIVLTKSNIIIAYSKCDLDINIRYPYEYINPEYKEILAVEQKAISSECFAVFDFEGNCLFAYMTDAKDDNFVELQEVTSFLKKDDETIYLLVYLFDGYLVVLELNLKNYAIKEVLSLEAFSESVYSLRAMTKKNNDWYFLATNYEQLKKRDPSIFMSYILKLTENESLECIGECCYSAGALGNCDGSFSVPFGLILKDINQTSCYVKI
jgi:hypothetical protein